MEYIDLYDRNGLLLGKRIPKHGERSPEEYYLHTHILICDKDNRYLLQQRSLSTHYLPGKWDVTGGGAQAGESSLEAAIREAKEELGLDIPAAAMQLAGQRVDEAAGRCLLDVYCVKFDFSVEGCRLRKEEVEAVRLVDFAEFVETVCYNKDEIYRGILNRADKLLRAADADERPAEKLRREFAEINAKTIDGWVAEGWEWGKPIPHEVYAAAQKGEWEVLLTPLKPVPKEWFCPMEGAAVLGLASGGGQQMPIFAALGAKCTVLDYSNAQLASERMVAEREGYAIDIVKADMTKRLPFDDESFDLIFHPVSNCYIEDVQHVWDECFRVLKPGGILLAGLDNGLNFAFDESCTRLAHRLPFNPLKDPVLFKELMEAGDGVQFSHTIEEQIGGQIKAGLTLTDVFGDTDESFLSYNLPTFWATRAVKK